MFTLLVMPFVSLLIRRKERRGLTNSEAERNSRRRHRNPTTTAYIIEPTGGCEQTRSPHHVWRTSLGGGDTILGSGRAKESKIPHLSTSTGRFPLRTKAILVRDRKDSCGYMLSRYMCQKEGWPNGGSKVRYMAYGTTLS